MSKRIGIAPKEEMVRVHMLMQKDAHQKLKMHAEKINKWFEKSDHKRTEKAATVTSVILDALDFYFQQNFYEDGTPIVVPQTHPLPLHVIHKNFYAREGEPV